MLPSTAPASVAPSAAAIVVPDAIKTAGKLVWCVDVSYPPEESYKADGTTAEGSDIDIATEIGTRFGVTTTIDNTGFDGIIPALNASKCDLIISGMNDTAERAKQVAFVDYLKVGQGLLVPAGNPKGIKTLEDLSGKAVAVQLGVGKLRAQHGLRGERQRDGQRRRHFERPCHPHYDRHDDLHYERHYERRYEWHCRRQRRTHDHVDAHQCWRWQRDELRSDWSPNERRRRRNPARIRTGWRARHDGRRLDPDWSIRRKSIRVDRGRSDRRRPRDGIS